MKITVETLDEMTDIVNNFVRHDLQFNSYKKMVNGLSNSLEAIKRFFYSGNKFITVRAEIKLEGI